MLEIHYVYSIIFNVNYLYYIKNDLFLFLINGYMIIKEINELKQMNLK